MKKMNKWVLYTFVIVFTVVNSEYLYAYTGDCINISGNEDYRVNIGDISLTKSTNIANSIIYDQELTIPSLRAECDCSESAEIPGTMFTGDTSSYSDFVDNYKGLSWYTIPHQDDFAYSLEVDIYDGVNDIFQRKGIPFPSFANNTPEYNCKGPVSTNSLTKGRLRIRVLKPILGKQKIFNPLGYFRMRRSQAPAPSSPIFLRILAEGTISSAHQCSVTGSFTSKYTFATSFLNDFDNEHPSFNTQIPSQTHVSNIYCNYSNVPVEIEFLGDFSNYGLKTDLDGVQIFSVLPISIFGKKYIIRNTENKFLTSLDSNGYKKIQFTSVPILTLPKPQVTLGEYSATMHIRVNFK
ncbi:hypothetical protein AB4441_09090 [Vibrio splendidus]